MEEHVLENMWFQQDGTTCYTSRANMALLQETFPGRVISRHQDHLISHHYNFLCGNAKVHVYADTSSTLKHLTNIRQIMAETPPNMFQK